MGSVDKGSNASTRTHQQETQFEINVPCEDHFLRVKTTTSNDYMYRNHS